MSCGAVTISIQDYQPGVSDSFGSVLFLFIFLMFSGSMSALLLAQYVTITVTDEAFTHKSLFGKKKFNWSEIERYDTLSSNATGVAIVGKNGKKVSIPMAYVQNSAELFQIIKARVNMNEDNSTITGQYTGRYFIAAIIMLFAVIFGINGISLLSNFDPISIPFLLIPLLSIAYTALLLTYVVTLTGNTLNVSSCYGSKQIKITTDTDIKISAPFSDSGQSYLIQSADKTDSIEFKDSRGKKIVLDGRLTNFSRFHARIEELLASSSRK